MTASLRRNPTTIAASTVAKDSADTPFGSQGMKEGSFVFLSRSTDSHRTVGRSAE
jgi:hypothetical protein